MSRFLSLLLFVIASASSAEQTDQSETLIIANSKAWKPFSFINSSGQPAGILIDYWREYSRVTGQPVEFLLLDWADSLKAVADGRADFHAGLLLSKERDRYLDFSQPILTIDTQLFVNKTLLSYEISELITGEHNFTLGVVEGGFEQEYASKNFPKLATVNYSNNQELIKAAFEGRIDAFVADLQVANFYFQSVGRSDQFASVFHLYSGIVRPAVAEGNGGMLLKIAEGMSLISEEDKHRIFNRWMYIETVYPNYLMPLLLMLMIIAIISYMIMLRMAVKAKTRQLEKANSELRCLSETDQLTGLSNRRHFYQEFSKTVAQGSSVSVLLFDIDDFKTINDTYGHQVGDVVIQQVGRAVKQVSKNSYLLGRIGGEEFAAVCRNSTVEEASQYAEALCDVVRKLKVFDDAQHVTISLGCAYYKKSSEAISLSEADRLMYQAKMKGKDQIVMEIVEQGSDSLQPITQ
ncbi:sensor domain-containing diguanylate cyclase [Vibrio scophthalmi]|uniref:sensor domain-containing diguanylate cyclase n=1 Tax=Vibrio scophthalmi TaxID=45658 RepID=UPI003873679E